MSIPFASAICFPAPAASGSAAAGASRQQHDRIATRTLRACFILTLRARVAWSGRWPLPAMLERSVSQNGHDSGLTTPANPTTEHRNGQAHALSCRALAFVDHPMDAGRGRRAL